MPVTELQKVINERILYLRSIERILHSDKFNSAFEKSNSEEKSKLLLAIQNNDKESILLWIKNILDDRNIFELRQLGKKFGIKNFNKLPKGILIEEIRNVKKAQIFN